MTARNEAEPMALRPREAARMLGISERFLWDLTQRGQVPCMRLGKGKRRPVLYPVAALRNWLAGCGRDGGAATEEVAT